MGNGESFGSYLGEVYANMFPGRVRAIAIDGIVDPTTYASTHATANVPIIVRVGVGAASDRALTELLTLCQQAGSSKCSFASSDTRARFAALAATLKVHPLRLAAPGVKTTTFTYACATDTWTAQDPDVYRGPFTHRTGNPVLVIGAVWDPATAYSNAVKVAQMLPSSRLISSDNWGHTSLGTGACVDNDTFAYLINWVRVWLRRWSCRWQYRELAAIRMLYLMFVRLIGWLAQHEQSGVFGGRRSAEQDQPAAEPGRRRD